MERLVAPFWHDQLFELARERELARLVAVVLRRAVDFARLAAGRLLVLVAVVRFRRVSAAFFAASLRFSAVARFRRVSAAFFAASLRSAAVVRLRRVSAAFFAASLRFWAAARFRRVSAAFFAASLLADAGRVSVVSPPFLAGSLLMVALPRPEPPGFFPPPVMALTVAQARRSASRVGTPRSLYPSSICSA